MSGRAMIAVVALVAMTGCVDTPNEVVRRRQKCEALIAFAKTPSDSALLYGATPEAGAVLPCANYLKLGAEP